MPKISIREIDNTGAETFEYNDYTVLVPGIYLEYVKNGETVALGEDKEVFTSKSDFEHEFTNVPADCGYERDLGFLMAYELVKRGLTVRYKGAYNYELESGEVISETTPKAYITYEEPITHAEKELTADILFSEFTDRYYDLRFITIGGLDFDQKLASIAALKCAGDRGDAVAILDVPEEGLIELDPDYAESGESIVKEKLNNAILIDSWVNQTFSGIASDVIERKGISWTNNDAEPETYGRYGAIFAPKATIGFSVKDPTTKLVSTEYFKFPASFDYLACFAQQLAHYPAWFATAGSVRGVSPYTSLVPTLKFKDADIDLLQPRSVPDGAPEVLGHIATDVISEIKPYGYILWGNRTMHPLSAPSSDTSLPAQLTASSFLNIRQLCCSLKKTIYRAAKRYTFDPNSDALWYNFKGAITPLLEEMKNNQGIRGYQIVKVPTKKKALLIARIIITPIEAVEDFDIDVVLSDNIEVTE